MLAGATATGKTRLSLGLAEQIGGAEIISADSRQVYRGMDIGTAKATRGDRARVPHHGLDLVDPDEPFSVADFQRHAYRALGSIGGRGGVAILVGGTGLYLRAVARGVELSPASADPVVRARLEERLAEAGLAALADELVRLAPRLARATDLANPRRVVRALERAYLQGDVLPPVPRGYPGHVLWLGLRLEPSVHRERIAERAAAQFSTGLLEEAMVLRQRYPVTLPAFSAFGYREAFGLVSGETDRETALRSTIDRTRAYARSQQTWFRSEPGIEWLDGGGDALADATARVASFLDRRKPEVTR